MSERIKTIVYNAVIAAIYVVLTLASYPISFGMIQFRISEMLILLCFFRKDYAIGLTLGCVIVNMFSSIGFIDCLFGGLATLISCVLVGFCRQLIVAVFIPIICNAFVVGFELYQFMQCDFWISVLWVGLGELVVLTVAYILLMIFKKRPKLHDILRSNQNIDFKF